MARRNPNMDPRDPQSNIIQNGQPDTELADIHDEISPEDISKEEQARIDALYRHAVETATTERAPKDSSDTTFSRWLAEHPTYQPDLDASLDRSIPQPLSSAETIEQNEQPTTEPVDPPFEQALSPEDTPAAAPKPPPAPDPMEDIGVCRTLGEALLKYGTPGQPLYQQEFNPNHVDYAHMSRNRRRAVIKNLLIRSDLLISKTQARDPDFWPTGHFTHNPETGERISPRRKGRRGPYPPGSRKGMGNREGNPAYTEHPESMSLKQFWLWIFEYNDKAPTQDKLSDADIVVCINELYPYNKKNVGHVAKMRVLFNNKLIPNQIYVPYPPLTRFSRQPIDPLNPAKGYRVFVLSNKSKARACLNDPGWSSRQQPPKPAGYKPKIEYPFPANAPMWFKWFDGRIVTPSEFELRTAERETVNG